MASLSLVDGHPVWLRLEDVTRAVIVTERDNDLRQKSVVLGGLLAKFGEKFECILFDVRRNETTQNS
jgi:hypothetical protein